MKEILCWDNIEHEFKRLKITPKKTYEGTGWSDDDRRTVYELTDKQFKILNNDTYNEMEMEGAWRYAKGSNCGSADWTFLVNGKKMSGFEPRDLEEYEEMLKEEQNRIFEERGTLIDIDDIELPVNEYDHLLQYICDEVGASTEKNVTAVAVSLARGNDMTLGELFKTYQGNKIKKRKVKC